MKFKYFELLGIEPSFDIDLKDLRIRHRKLLRENHPDNFNSDSEKKRIAIERSALLNEAFAKLESPVTRAMYILGLENNDISPPPHFMMKQLDWRERLENKDTANLNEEVESELERNLSELSTFFKKYLSSSPIETKKGVQVKIAELSFILKFRSDLENT